MNNFSEIKIIFKTINHKFRFSRSYDNKLGFGVDKKLICGVRLVGLIGLLWGFILGLSRYSDRSNSIFLFSIWPLGNVYAFKFRNNPPPPPTPRL